MNVIPHESPEQRKLREQRAALLPIRCHGAWLTAETNRILDGWRAEREAQDEQG